MLIPTIVMGTLAITLILIAYFVASLITFCVYGLDKRAAVRGRWRTPEATLHLLQRQSLHRSSEQ